MGSAAVLVFGQTRLLPLGKDSITAGTTKARAIRPLPGACPLLSWDARNAHSTASPASRRALGEICGLAQTNIGNTPSGRTESKEGVHDGAVIFVGKDICWKCRRVARQGAVWPHFRGARRGTTVVGTVGATAVAQAATTTTVTTNTLQCWAQTSKLTQPASSAVTYKTNSTPPSVPPGGTFTDTFAPNGVSSVPAKTGTYAIDYFGTTTVRLALPTGVTVASGPTFTSAGATTTRPHSQQRTRP